MYTLWVTVEVRNDRIDAFIAGIRENAEASLRDEPGCLRFDVHQSVANPNQFHFYEIYATKTAFEIEHRNAAHYAAWQETVRTCVIPGTQHIVFSQPRFPELLPER